MIEIQQLCIQFTNSHDLLFDQFSLKIQAGDKILIVGPSGSGKSVLLKTIMGILPRACVLDGKFRVGDQWMDYAAYQQHPIHHRFSAIFQDAVNSLHPYRTIARQFSFASQTDIQACCQQFRLQFQSIINTFSRKLSGGQCQRISIMFPYLLRNQNIVVFDEPITDIDPISHKSILKRIKSEFLSNPDKTVLYVTHQLNEIEEINFKQYVLKQNALKQNDMLAPDLHLPRLEKQKSDRPIMKVHIPWFQYPNAHANHFSLRHIQLDIHPGDSIGIFGESGSGKSTLLNMMAGLLPTLEPNQVFVQNPAQPSHLCPFNKCKKPYNYLQIVFQDNVGSLFEQETIEQSLRHIARIKKLPIEEIHAQANLFFTQLSLITDQNSTKKDYRDTFEQFLKKQVIQLSMGMVRRFCLAKALLLMNIYNEKDRQTPKILLLDEISRGLDSFTKQKMIFFLQSIQQDYSLTFIAISHEQSFLMSFCHKFYFMFKGFQIPKAYSKADLQNYQSIRNTYIRRYFIPCEEPAPYPSDGDQPSGNCFFQQFYQCSERNSDCIQPKKETWICV
jgi:ABC-type glutathione transport system ATPase component